MMDKRDFSYGRVARWIYGGGILLVGSLLGSCGGGGGVYGPAYVPECTCCCSNYYTPYSYHATAKSTAPISAAMLHDTTGPLPNVSANHGSIKGIAKKGGHK
ncbi:MAG: hypothetical protein ACYCT9_04895 [Leptospirillum sp.]|jgi:hypothetical protein